MLSRLVARDREVFRHILVEPFQLSKQTLIRKVHRPGIVMKIMRRCPR